MSSSLDHKCQRCGSQYHGQICPFCTITGLDVNALLASEGLSMPAVPAEAEAPETPAADPSTVHLVDVVSNRNYAITNAVCRFGRDISNDTVLTGDKSLSRFHFQVTIVNGDYFVEDAGSRNGTFLNGAPVTAPKKLLNGDIISAGMSRYRFVYGEDLGTMGTPPTEEGAGAIDVEANAKPTSEVSMDPLAKIMQEGQALLGNTGESEDASDLDNFFNKDDAEKSGNGTGDSGFMQLERPKETPIDELFQQQIRAAVEAKEKEEAASAASKQDSQPAAEQPAPAAKATTSTHEWPEWCMNYTFPEIVEIKSKMEKLELEIRERQEQLSELGATVSKTEDVRNRVLATEGTELVLACSEVLQILGFETATNGTSPNEVVLTSDGKAVAIAKIVSTDGQPRPADLANLVSSLSTYWCDNGVEPKGILVVSMRQDGNPDDRPEFTKDIVDYASKKNLCLLNTVQLLAMYRDASLRSANVESIRTDLLGASGHLSGFEAVTSKAK